MRREKPRVLQPERRSSSCRPRSKKLADTSSTRLLLRESHKYLNGAPASARHLQSRVDLNKLHASVPTLLQSGAKHAHCSCRGPQRHLTPALPRFFSSSSPPPFLPVSQRGSGEWRLFHEASAERQSISYIWWISPDWDKLGSRTKRYALARLPHLHHHHHHHRCSSTLSTLTPPSQPPLSPTQLGERFTQQFRSWNRALHLFPLLSLYLPHLSISSSQNDDTSRRETGVDLNLGLTRRDIATFIFLLLLWFMQLDRKAASGFDLFFWDLY